MGKGNEKTIETTKPRRWFRFRLRTLLVMVTLLSIPLGWVSWELDQRRKEKVVTAWVEEIGGVVQFIESDRDNRWVETKDKWFGKTVKSVTLDEINVTDLSPLTKFKNLTLLRINRFQVSKEQVQELQQALPNCGIYIYRPRNN